jgi:predicted dehydrogenase
MNGIHRAAFAVTVAAALPLAAQAGEEKVIRAGAIGLDTSHATAFAAIFNDPKNADHVPGLRIVAAFPGGSPDIEKNAENIAKCTAELRDKRGVEIVPDIPTLCSKVDAVLLLSVDGRRHLEQAKGVIAAKKPFFIDTPMAASLADGREIFRLAKEAGVPVFSASALRFVPGIAGALKDESIGKVLSCDAYSPIDFEPHHPDLFWYGIHGVEILFTLMGPDCESVTRIVAPEGGKIEETVVVGRWKNGRVGTFRGLPKGGAQIYEISGALVFGEKRVVRAEPNGGSLYRGLLVEVVKFFGTGVPPVSAEETLKILAFMEAADASKKEGGKPVPLAK